MKKLTLDQTWKKCLSMWRWIAKQKREGSSKDGVGLKHEWLENHGWQQFKIQENCFFCERAVLLIGHTDTLGVGCSGKCPAQKIEKDFDCQVNGCHWAYDPIAFYNKLVSLNRKRLAKKK